MTRQLPPGLNTTRVIHVGFVVNKDGQGGVFL